MSKQRHDHPDMIEEIESAAERMAEWIGQHAIAVGIVLVLVLGAAAGYGLQHSWSRQAEDEASNALDHTRSDYLKAIGASPGALTEPELANPAAARAIREEYLPKYEALAEKYSGTVSGTLALFEAAALLEALDRPEQTAATWQRALEQSRGNPGLQGLLYQRIADAAERRGAWTEAAEAHERAAAIEDYPLRYWALADAARCRAAAGQPAEALALYERVEAEAPDLSLPPHIRTQIRELRATVAH